MKHVCKLLWLGCVGASLAHAQAPVEGEKWRITSSMQMAGMSMPGMSSEICKQPGEDTAPIKTDDNCQIYDMKREGNVQSFKMRCTGKDAMEGSAQFTYLGSDRYQGKMEMTAQGETMVMNYEGQKLGRCDGGEMNLQAKKMIADGERQQKLAEQQQIEACHKEAAKAESPGFLSMCKDPADQRTYCEAIRTHDKFKRLDEQEQQNAKWAQHDPNNLNARPLTNSARICGFAIDKERDGLCTTAEQNGKLDFIASQCPTLAAGIAAAQCAGRRYTAIADRYRGFCSEYASNQSQAEQQQAETPMDKTKGLFNKGKKALGGLFTN
ncbi:MAG TPA: DUF3617 family protein [Steroidobacter sp.]|uniref:DUF3617 domain-containing protein n=1 Tax=Steroidobacter sp. TaxID=1978227 RepID=UPI002EDAAC0A